MRSLIYFEKDLSPAGSFFPSNASWQCPWVWCSWAKRVVFEIQWGAVGAPTGTLTLEANGQVAQPGATPGVGSAWTFPVPAPAGAAGTYGAWPNVVGAAGNASIVVLNPIRFHRITYTLLGGGDPAAGFLVNCTMHR